MGIWIRSQDKKRLKLCNEFIICGRVKNKKIVGYSVYCFDVELGVYSTEEKALKVLDMIEKGITGEIVGGYIRDCPLAGKEFHFVFQMPADEEVKV